MNLIPPMNKIKFLTIILACLIFSIGLLAKSKEPKTNIENDGKYAWSQGIGWLNFAPEQGGVLVTDNALTGYAWSPAAGWILMDPPQAGVKNDGQGSLSGFAWGENIGWINFGPQGEGVKINKDGIFSGWAWGENIGWISFNCQETYSCGVADYKVKTSWRPSEVKSDTAPPQTKIMPKSGRYKNNQTVVFFANDNAGGSGVEGIYYTFNKSTNFVKYSQSLRITKDTVLSFYAQDRKGNKEAIKKAKYNIAKGRFVSKSRTNSEVKIKKDALYYANDFNFSFSTFPKKLRKEKYYLEIERIRKYAPNLPNAKNNSLKKYWQVNANLGKYQVMGKEDIFKVKLVFSYSQKEFNELQKRQKSLKTEDLKLRYYNVKDKEWKDVLAKLNKEENTLTYTYTVNILSPKFFYPQMLFVIGK